jgi:hypothetical protein
LLKILLELAETGMLLAVAIVIAFRAFGKAVVAALEFLANPRENKRRATTQKVSVRIK